MAALYVTGQTLRGWRLEAQAEAMVGDSEQNRQIKNEKIADAKTFYAMASLTKVWVLLLIFLGTLINVGLGIAQGPWTG